MTLLEKLTAVQAEIKAPKSLVNRFGGYNYRNAESIYESFKPLAKKYGLTLVIADDLIEVGGRIYIRATASLYDAESDAPPISVTALAREEEAKKGMDGAQISGAASSYARKYCVSGLLLLDDTKDPDTVDYTLRTGTKAPSSDYDDIPGYPSRGEMIHFCDEYYKGDNRKKMLDFFHAKSLSEMTTAQVATAWKKAQKGAQ